MAHIYNINLPLSGGGGGIDTSKDTVTPDALREGFTAHDASGEPIEGTIPDYSGGNTVEMTSPDGATLNTAGTYCESNIEVIPKLQEKTATTGEVVTPDAGYAGLKSVDTAPVYDAGVEAGKKSEYDAFWDNAQLNGNRFVYQMFCASVGIPSEFLKKPKYPFVLKDAAYNFMSQYNTAYGTEVGGDKNIYTAPMDLSSWEIDTSEVTNASCFFHNASVANLTLDFSNATTLSQAFQSSSRGCPNNITIKVSEKCASLNYAFAHAMHSEYCADVVRFSEGSVIACGDLKLQWTNLSKESLISVINALSSATSGLPVALRLKCVDKEFETSAGANDGSTSEEWLNLVATKPNWTISLSN